MDIEDDGTSSISILGQNTILSNLRLSRLVEPPNSAGKTSVHEHYPGQAQRTRKQCSKRVPWSTTKICPRVSPKTGWIPMRRTLGADGSRPTFTTHGPWRPRSRAQTSKTCETELANYSDAPLPKKHARCEKWCT